MTRSTLLKIYLVCLVIAAIFVGIAIRFEDQIPWTLRVAMFVVVATLIVTGLLTLAALLFQGGGRILNNLRRVVRMLFGSA